MRLTGSVSYAVGVLLKVHRDGEGQPMTAARIARGARFPPRFLYRILRRLVDAELLTGVSGPGGGYALARSARQINLFDVVTAVEGPEEPHELRPVSPQHAGAIGLINQLVDRSNAAFRRHLKATTLEKLAAAKRSAIKKSKPPKARRSPSR